MKSLFDYINEMAVDPIADNIRKDLKAKGIKVPGQVNVRTRRGGLSNAYDIIIKDLKVDADELRKIVKKYEDIDYDERTGEILSGGNTYIFIKYDDTAERDEQRRLQKTVEQLVDQAMMDKGREVKLKNGYTFGVFTDTKDYDADKIKKGYAEPYKHLFFVRKNGKDVTRDFGAMWWLLVKAGY